MTRPKLTLWLMTAGLASAAFVFCLLPLAIYVAGALFGAAIAIALQKLGIFNQRQAGWFVVVAALAYYVSLLLALALAVFTRKTASHSPEPLIIGASVGALLVVGGALFLLRPKVTSAVVLVLAFCGAAGGALLSAAGSALGPSLGLVVSKLLYNLPSHLAPTSSLPDPYSLQNLYAVFVVWQTGMGFVLGLMLGGRQGAAREVEQ